MQSAAEYKEYRRMLDLTNDRDTTGDVLLEIFNSGNSNLQKAAVQHRNFPTEKILEIISDVKHPLAMVAVCHRTFRGELLYMVKDHPSRHVRKYVARRGIQAPFDLHMHFVEDSDRHVVEGVARNFEAPIEALERILTMDVRNAVKDYALLNLRRQRTDYKDFPDEWFEAMYGHPYPTGFRATHFFY